MFQQVLNSDLRIAYVVHKVALPEAVTQSSVVELRGRDVICWLNRKLVEPKRFVPRKVAMNGV